MTEKFDIQKYLAGGVEKVVKDAVRATLKDPRESAFMASFALSSSKATKKRIEEEAAGLHVPPFLIASITSSCNLHCAGCYSRSNNATVDCAPVKQLTDEEWLAVFREASTLGVSFILLAGGEPMLRRDIIEEAAKIKDILFPIFTNGTFMDERYYELFDKNRNLIPIMSIEGGKEETDSRRGEGIYDRLVSNMEALYSRGLIWGASVTVTKENLRQCVSEEFLGALASKGCKAVIFVEYVPVTSESQDLAPDDGDREFLRSSIARLRQENDQMLYISFPGDEKSSGGCLAAGRGFFHINSHGGAEPCPFSAYSDINVKDTSLREALSSGLFTAIRDGGLLIEDHAGGCVLFERRKEVEEIVDRLRSEKKA